MDNNDADDEVSSKYINRWTQCIFLGRGTWMSQIENMSILALNVIVIVIKMTAKYRFIRRFIFFK
jgi:hypothetical protein